jgi:hypothetical protein
MKPPPHVIWFDKPRPLFPGCKIMVVGIMSDAPPELFKAWFQ